MNRFQKKNTPADNFSVGRCVKNCENSLSLVSLLREQKTTDQGLTSVALQYTVTVNSLYNKNADDRFWIIQMTNSAILSLKFGQYLAIHCPYQFFYVIKSRLPGCAIKLGYYILISLKMLIFLKYMATML